MHYVRLQFTRDVLESHHACGEGLDFYDEIADDNGNLVIEWSPLTALWLACAKPEYSRWLRKSGLIPRTELSGYDLSGMDLHGAYLAYARLEGTDLSGANLYEANLDGAALNDADLRNANLSYASLKSADLRYAMLGGAHLVGATLNDACLRGINVSILKE